MTKRIWLIIFVMQCLLQTAIYASESPRTIYATPRGGPAYFQNRTIKTEEFNTAIRKSKPGDTVLVLPGTYTGYVEIGKQVDPDNPVRIMGIDGLSVIACSDLPANSGKSPFRFSVAKGIEIRGLKFLNCWPSAVEITDSEFISVVENEFIGSKSPIIVKQRSSHHILIEANRWNQTPGGKKFANAKPEDFSDGGTLAGFGGALATFVDVAGEIIIRRNIIEKSHSLAQIHATADKTNFPTRNIQIYENRGDSLFGDFISIRSKTENLWIHDNKLINSRNFLGLAQTQQKNVFVISNLLRNDSLQTEEAALLSSSAATPEKNGAELYVLNNTMICASRSAQLSWSPQRLYHINNVIDGCGSPSAPFDTSLSKTSKQSVFERDFFVGFDAAVRKSFTGLDKSALWSDSAGFADKDKGEYFLAPQSPGTGKGVRISLPLENAWDTKRFDVGILHPSSLATGPRFRGDKNEITGAARLVLVSKADSKTLQLYLSHSGDKSLIKKALWETKDGEKLESAPCVQKNYRVACTFAKELGDEMTPQPLWLEIAEDAKLTSWAAEGALVKLLRVKKEG